MKLILKLASAIYSILLLVAEVLNICETVLRFNLNINPLNYIKGF